MQDLDLSYLRSLDHESFERERRRLIAVEIVKAPPEHRSKLIKLQAALDALRVLVSPTVFMNQCLSTAHENLENMGDLVGQLSHLTNTLPPILPPSER